MKTQRSLLQTIAGSIVLGTIFLCALVARGAVMIPNPNKEETPATVSKTIGQVTTFLLGDGKKNLYFNPNAFPKGSVGTWAELGDRLIAFVKNYRPLNLSKKYDTAVQADAKRFKQAGIDAINTLHIIRNSNAHTALLQKTVSKENYANLTSKLAGIKKVSADVKRALKKLETRIKKHEKSGIYPAEKMVSGKMGRTSLSNIEKKLRDALTSVDVIIDRLLKDAELQNFTKGLTGVNNTATSKGTAIARN